jgi:hypothetical protein
MGVEAVGIKDEGGVDGRVDMRPDWMAKLFVGKDVKLLFLRNSSQRDRLLNSFLSLRSSTTIQG